MYKFNILIVNIIFHRSKKLYVMFFYSYDIEKKKIEKLFSLSQLCLPIRFFFKFTSFRYTYLNKVYTYTVELSA